MARVAGQINSYNQDWNLIKDYKWLMDYDPSIPVPLLDKCWRSDATSLMSNGIWGFEIKWDEQTPYAGYTTLNGGINNSTTTVVVDDSNGIIPGNLLRIDDEVFKVASVVYSTHTITVETRPYNGSAATHDDAATVWILPTATSEAVTSFTSNTTYQTAANTPLINYAQSSYVVMDKTLRQRFEETGLNVRSNYTEDTIKLEWGKEKRRIENALIFGVRKARSSATTDDNMGGLLYFLNTYASTKATSVTGDLKFEHITGAAQGIYGGEGIANLIMMSPSDFDVINRGWGDQVIVQRTDPTIGRQVKTIDTGFAVLDIIVHPRWPSKTMVLGRYEDIIIAPVKHDKMNFDVALYETPRTGTIAQEVLMCSYNSMYTNLNRNFWKISGYTNVDTDGV